MRRSLILSILLLAPLARAADPLPSMEELQKSLDDKNYPAVLTGTSRVLQLRGPVTASYHRTAVWMLKAEAQVQSSQFLAAAQAYTGGAEEKDATPDEKDLALASAMLMKHSDRKGYQPAATREHPAPQAFDVLDPAKRKDAMAALFEVNLADLTQRAGNTKDALNPGPIVVVLKKIAEQRPLERTVDKSTDKLDAIEKIIGQNYTDQITKWSTACTTRLDALQTLSQQTIIKPYTDARGQTQNRTTIRGLMSPEQTEIRNMTSAAKNYAQAEQQISDLMGDAGKAAITPSQQLIQTVFDQSQTVIRAALVPR